MRFARYTGLTPAAMVLAAQSYRDNALRHLGEIRGLEGVTLATDDQAGSLAVITFWESERDMHAGERRFSAETRDHASLASHTELQTLVDHFEITVASGLDRQTRVEAGVI